MRRLASFGRSRAIEEVGIEYELVKPQSPAETKQPEYLKINPNGKIPALVDGDVTLFESMAINLYLARKYDGGLQPKGPEDEARALQWSFWAIIELQPQLLEIMGHKLTLPEDQRDPAKFLCANVDAHIVALHQDLSSSCKLGPGYSRPCTFTY